MRKTLIVLLSVIICIGCTVLESPPNSPVVTVTRKVMQQTSVATTTITSTASPLVTLDPMPQQDIVVPELINICPNDRVVKFEDLGLTKDLRLLLLPNTVDASPQIPGEPLSLSSENPLPSHMFDDKLYDFSVSPDHKWIYFNRPDDNGQHSILWVSSLDGKEQWPVVALDSETYTGYASWISDQDIFIIGSPHESEVSALDPWEYMPFMSVNPFTLETRQLIYLARDPNDELFYYGAVIADNKSFGLYGKLNRVDFIYDYENNKTLPAFRWLESVDSMEVQFPPVWVYDDGKFAITIARPHGIDLAFNLNIQSVSEDIRYDDVMKQIVFPERLLPSFVLGIVPGKELVALQRFDFFNPSQGEKWFYTLDYDNQIVYNYCLDLRDTVKRVKFSSDGKFVAFSLEDFAADQQQDQHYVIILNLRKGTTSYLKGYTLVDWGVVDQ
jgi:hypothetical protein